MTCRSISSVAVVAVSFILGGCSHKPAQPAPKKDCVAIQAGRAVFVPCPKGLETRDTKGVDTALAHSFSTADRSTTPVKRQVARRQK
jgi:hypothetical protein